MSADWIQKDPPPTKRATAVWGRRKDFIAKLKAEPGIWYQYLPGHHHASATAANFRTSFPGVEATQAKRDGDGYDVYVRWMGEA